MNLLTVALGFALLLSSVSVEAQRLKKREFFQAARSITPDKINDSTVMAAIADGLINSDGSAAAIVMTQSNASLVLVFILQPNGGHAQTTSAMKPSL